MFENKLLRACELKRDKVARLEDNEDFHKDEMGGSCNTHGRMINAYTGLVGWTELKKPLGRHKRRTEYNIKIYLQEVRWQVTDWIGVFQDSAGCGFL
jgi:hypothetical protein